MEERINLFKATAGVGTEICKHCGHVIKEYRRKISLDMCLALIILYKHYKYSETELDILDYVEARDVFTGNESLLKNFTRLKNWDLIEGRYRQRKNGELVQIKGYYRLSDNGIKWVQREIFVPEVSLVKRGVVTGFNTERMIGIDDILKAADLSYDTLMSPNNNFKVQ